MSWFVPDQIVSETNEDICLLNIRVLRVKRVGGVNLFVKLCYLSLQLLLALGRGRCRRYRALFGRGGSRG